MVSVYTSNFGDSRIECYLEVAIEILVLNLRLHPPMSYLRERFIIVIASSLVIGLSGRGEIITKGFNDIATASRL